MAETINKPNYKNANAMFEAIKHVDDSGVEFWLARELMLLLEYNEWRNFLNVIVKAQDSLRASYPHIDDHFVGLNKMITIAGGTDKEASRSVKDYKLTRRACYLIAQNGDTKKAAIALAQNYFATQTRKQEVVQIREKDIERILARRKLSESEKKFAGTMNERGVEGKGIAEIKSAGDEALFGSTTQQVKSSLGIKSNKPLADHLPTITIKAKDLATEMTTHKTVTEDLVGKDRIKTEHVSNNYAVRKMLTESGIFPEALPAEEDVKNLEKKYSDNEISELEDSKILAIDILEIDIRDVFNEEELLRIKEIIDANQGNALIKIYYGSYSEPKIIERSIQVTPEVISSLKKYLVITENSVE